MFQTLSHIHPKQHYHKRVCSILTNPLNNPTNSYLSTDASIDNQTTPSFSNANQTHKALPSPNFSSIARTVISRFSDIWGTNKGETFTSFSLKDYFLRLSEVSPEVVRRFWRVSVLEPQDVVEILVGFEFEGGRCDVEVRKVESLWGVFKVASEGRVGFEHLPQSCRIMASMLVRVGMFREVEWVLSRRESQGILLDCKDVFCDLIEGYLGEFELDRALSVYERVRRMDVVPSLSSYQDLLKYLIEVNETELVYRVYVDMIKMGMGGSVEEKGIHENVVRLLCVDGRVQEGRNLVMEVMNCGIRPSNLVVNAISCGYCNKKDYNDLLSFFAELRIAPDVILGNKILLSLCKTFGVEEGNLFLLEWEELGFCPDEISLGILIGSSCRERKLKNAFFYISDILSRGLKPHVHSYNALLSGLVKEGMYPHTRDILVEMSDRGVIPNMSTFRVLLAGFCQARKFDEVEAIVREMVDHNLVKLSSMEDPLTKGFELLGFNPLTVKIRRDNDKGFSKTEFYDNLGNGLYLDANIDVFEEKIAQVLNDVMLPDFNSCILENFRNPNIKSTLLMVDEMTRWGQEMSLPTLSFLLSCLSRARFGVETINHHLELICKSIYQLDQKTLNFLVQVYSKKGFTYRARTLFDGMVRRGYAINNNTYSALLFDICKKGDFRSFHYFWTIARNSNWSPKEKDSKVLLVYLCKNKWFNEALELFEAMLLASPYDACDNFHSLLEQLCQEKKFKDEASKIFETMLSHNILPPVDVSTQFISHLCRTNFERAIEFNNILLRDQPSSLLPVHCALINGFCKSGRFKEPATLFKEIMLKGFIPDADVYNSLIEGCCGGNNFNKVRELIGVMVRKNINISISSYSKMARMICIEGKLFAALNLKELMLQVTHHPELILYNILLFNISSMRNCFLLDSMVDALQRKGLKFDDATYNALIRGFLLCKDSSRSLHYLMAMMKQDLKPSNRSLREVISCLCHNGQLELALRLSREMESRGWIHGTVLQNIIVEALLRNGNLQEAIEFLDRMVSKNLIPDTINYDYLIKKFYQYGRMDKAVDLLNMTLRKGIPPESTSYDYIIRGLCERRKLDTALDFYSEMLCRGLKPSMIAWDVLVCSFSECGRMEEAENMLRSMIVSGETPSRGCFMSVINKYKSEKNVGKTSELLKLMQEKGYVPDFNTHWSVISNLSDSGKKGGDSHGNGGFLSGLLSGFGFAGKKKHNSKVG